MKHAALFAFLFAGLVACDTPPSAPAPDDPGIAGPSFVKTHINESIDISGTIFNGCAPSELVAFEGRIHQNVIIDDDGAGTVKVQIRSNTQNLHGVGLTSGDKYTIHQNVKNDFELTPTTTEQEFDIRFRVIRQGSDDNLWLRQTVRFTFPPGTVEIIRNEFECRG